MDAWMWWLLAAWLLGAVGAIIVLTSGECECDERSADAEGLCHVCRKRT